MKKGTAALQMIRCAAAVPLRFYLSGLTEF